MILRVLLFIFCIFEFNKLTNSLSSQLKVGKNITIDKNFNITINDWNSRTEILGEKNFTQGLRNNSDISHLDKSMFIFDYDYGKNESLKKILSPKCNEHGFCEKVPYYPTEIIKKALRAKSTLKLLETHDQPPDPKPKFGDESDGLCKGITKYIIPLAARNKNGESKFIINTFEYVQSISVEICEDVNKPCRLIDGFAIGYETMCIQKYTYRKLAAISDNGEAYADWFAMPASCCCKIQYTNYKRQFLV